ncbi:MAG: DnaJ domain-containing protein [Leptolyngbyaceae cyanobacterium]
MASLNYYYGVLNLEPGSTKEDIKRACRRLAQQWHPDKFSKQPDQLQKARAKFEQIKEAYDTLIRVSRVDRHTTGHRVSVRAVSAEKHYEKGIGYLQQGQHKLAVDSFTQAVRKKTDYLQAYQARAFTLEQLGLDLQAKADFEKIAELKRDGRTASVNEDANSSIDAEIFFQRGLAQFKSRKYGAAIINLSKAIEINPNHKEAYRYRSQAYFRRGYDQQADADFKHMRDLASPTQQTASRATYKSSVASEVSAIWHCTYTLSRHTATVSAVAVTRDGKKLVTGSYDKTLRLWSTKTGSLLKTFNDHSKEIHCVTVSGDGKYIASGSADRTIKIWDLRTGELLRSFGNVLLGHSDTVTALAFSPNSQILASASRDKTVRLWSMKSGKEIYTFKDSSKAVLALAISSDGKSIFYGGGDNQLSTRHIKTGKQLRSFPGMPNQALALSRQGSLLAAASGPKITLWNRHYQKKLFELHGHAETVSSLVFNTDSQILVSGSHDTTVKLWNVHTGKTIDTLAGHQSAVCSVACSYDGKVLASGSADKTIKIWQQV